MNLIILQAIPSLIGYILIVQTFYCATWSFSEHNFRRWAKLMLIFLVISFLLKQLAWFRVCVISVVFNNFSLHPFFCLMLSMSDYIFMKPLDKCVMIIINIPSSPRISIEFLMRNTIRALDDLCYHRPLDCLPFNTNLFVFCVIPWDPCYPAFVLLYLGVTIFYVKNVVRISPPLKNSWCRWYLLPYPFIPWSPCYF